MYRYLSLLPLLSDMENTAQPKVTYAAVAPIYDRDPNTPQEYRAARERMAGLRKNRGLSVAA